MRCRRPCRQFPPARHPAPPPLLHRSTLRGRGALFGRGAEAGAAATARGRRSTLLGRSPVLRFGAKARAAAAACGQAGGKCWMNAGEPGRAGAEIAFCESVLAKAGLNVLSETFRDTAEITAWDHYPPGDVYDPASGAQWFYHCHPVEEGVAEHGHFHCFVRPEGPGGPIHHLVAVGVDRFGRLLRLFTVNQWVVGDDWADAGTTIRLLPRFDVEMPRPSYLVNRWLTAVLSAYQERIVELIRGRDAVLAAHEGDLPARQDRSLEVTSEFLPPAS